MADAELRTRKQIAHLAGVTERTVSRWIAAGRLPARKPGGQTSPVRVERADLDAVLKGKKT